MDQQTPISARASASDPSIATQGPIPLFDRHLGFLSKSYISFFQERKRLEEAYIDSLHRLHRKSKAVDTYLDNRVELSTARSVWAEVRDSVKIEAQVRQAFCGALTTDILTPLINLKETQERTRKRIKEDLKDSTQDYNDYAEVMLPRLKMQYVKKFNEMEPLHALDRRPSLSGPPARNHSPSSSTAFSDLAHQGKKQLNQLIGLLDRNATKEVLSGPGNQGVQTARIKRDADEADKDYRKGIHWLETLRLRRTKILEGGYNSLEMFVRESATTIKRTLEKYTDNTIATSTTQIRLSKQFRRIVDRVSPDKDLERLVVHTSRSLASAIPQHIFYEHGVVGRCNDLIFGFSLGDYATCKGLREGDIPKIIRICIAEIDKRGLEIEGIHQVSGRHAIVQALQHEIERDEDSFELTPKDDIYSVSSLLKLYLRELPEPLFRFSLQDRIQHSEALTEHQANNFMLLRSKMRRLPPVHRTTLRALIEHLARVVMHWDKNKMDAKNLAIVFGSMIFGEDELPKGGDLLNVQTIKDSLFEDLIMNVAILFDDNVTVYLLAPPLPPTPAGEVAPEVSYGFRSTKIATVSAKAQSPPPPGSPQIFTPMFPPRPATRIRPSSRNVPTSPLRTRVESPPLSTIGTQVSVSTPLSSSHTSILSRGSLFHHAPESLGETESSLFYQAPESPSGTEYSWQSGVTASIKKTELPPTPKESPFTLPLESPPSSNM